MKKILFAAVAALAITSCSQNEEIEAPSQKTKIDFTTAVGKSSRAVDATNANFNAFTVNSYITSSKYDGTAALPDPYMDNVKCTGGKNNWTINGNYYWPASDNVSFFAYSTLSEDTLTYAKGSTWPTLTFKMAGATENLRDVVAACAINTTLNSSGVTDGKLSLTFKHILTRINFSVKYEDENYTYTISSIKIKGVKSEGTYSYSSDVTTGTWVASGTAVDYEYPMNSSATADENKVIKLDDTHGSIIAIPQSLNGVTIEVNYKTEKDSQEFFNGTKNVTFTGKTWAVNQNIRYTLTLPVGATKMAVDTEIDNWTDATEEATPKTPSVN